MEKTMFSDVPIAERFALLRDNCTARRQESYYKDLTDEEIDQKNEGISTNCIKVFRLEEDLKQTKDRFKEQINPLKDETRELCEQVETRKERVNGDLFDFSDHEDGMMYTYNDLGEYIGSRRLTPEEKRSPGLMVAHSRTGTAD